MSSLLPDPDITQKRVHWDSVYGARAETALTWFEATPGVSLDLIRAHAHPGDPIIDIGGGASRLVDQLAGQGFGPLTVLDLSGAALASSKARLGDAGSDVTWIGADVTTWTPPETYALWHDRAVFHFMTSPSDRALYVMAMSAALQYGGTAIIGTFAEDGPETCSGLPVVRYSSDMLDKTIEALAPGVFERLSSQRHMHITPKGNRQSFQFTVFRKL